MNTGTSTATDQATIEKHTSNKNLESVIHDHPPHNPLVGISTSDDDDDEQFDICSTSNIDSSAIADGLVGSGDNTCMSTQGGSSSYSCQSPSPPTFSNISSSVLCK